MDRQADTSASGSAPANASLSSLLSHLSLVETNPAAVAGGEIGGAPIFTEPVRRFAQLEPKSDAFCQYGLLGLDTAKMSSSGISPGSGVSPYTNDPRLFYNVSAPASVFICGSQGSGKSHTLSCLLENCLLLSDANLLPRPLTGIVFHYDTFASDAGGTPCEAAYLASAEGVKVRILCPPTNIGKLRQVYGKLPRVTVEELRLNQSDFNTKRMLDLMAVSSVQGGGMPLYLHVVTRILRDLRITQQASGGHFNYADFRKRLEDEDLSPGQTAPLQQRLDTLESFMPLSQVPLNPFGKMVVPSRFARLRGFQEAPASVSLSSKAGVDWKPKPGQLTIVDLSCPCITQEAACALFNVCLSLFLEQDSEVGRVIALDEAHKYMNGSSECDTLTETLLSTIRLQRHLGARVLISTQEPTVSPKLLDLCSMTIVHRFTSPNWYHTLKTHLSGAKSIDDAHIRKAAASGYDSEEDILARIVSLRQGQGLLFAPSALVGLCDYAEGQKTPSDDQDSGTSAQSCVSSGSSETIVGTSDESSPESDNPDESSASPKKSSTCHSDTKPMVLGPRPLVIQVRKRITADGGRTVMAG